MDRRIDEAMAAHKWTGRYCNERHLDILTLQKVIVELLMMQGGCERSQVANQVECVTSDRATHIFLCKVDKETNLSARPVQ